MSVWAYISLFGDISAATDDVYIVLVETPFDAVEVLTNELNELVQDGAMTPQEARQVVNEFSQRGFVRQGNSSYEVRELSLPRGRQFNP